MYRTCVILFAVLASMVSLSAWAQIERKPSADRTWTSLDGKHRITASLVAVKEGWVKLRKPDGSTITAQLLSLGQAVTYTGASDTTLMKLIKKDILPCRQVAPYAPLEINKTDLDTDPVRSILDHLKETGVLVLEGVSLARQESLFQ